MRYLSLIILLPLLFVSPQQAQPATQFGVGHVDAQIYTDAGPWINWHHNGCADPDFLPMAWGKSSTLPANCDDGRPGLLLNECELQSQANCTPTEAAQVIYRHRNWRGPLYCCGNVEWGHAHLRQTIAEYRRLYGTLPPLDGIHIHLYSNNVSTMQAWRALADKYGYDIIVSEFGLALPTTAQIVSGMPSMIHNIKSIVRPSKALWFAYDIPTTWRGVTWYGYNWALLSLTDQHGRLTPVGMQYQLQTGWQFGSQPTFPPPTW